MKVVILKSHILTVKALLSVFSYVMNLVFIKT